MVRTTRDLHISIVSVSVLPLSQSAPVPKYSITELPPSPCAFFEYNVGRLWGGSTNLPRGTPQETREKQEGRGRWCTLNKRKHVCKYTFIWCGDAFDLQLNHVHFKRQTPGACIQTNQRKSQLQRKYPRSSTAFLFV